jgi:ornithine carbamoyltransferase
MIRVPARDFHALDDHRTEDLLATNQITADIVRRLSPETILIPCPPVTRGEEITEEVLHDPACRVVEAKSVLLHAQNALLEWIFAAS